MEDCMKIYKLSLILVAAAAVLFGLGETSFAFHSGGVKEGVGCLPSAQLTYISCHDQHGKRRWTTVGTYSKTSGAIYTSGSYGAIPLTFGPTGEMLPKVVYRLLRAAESVDGVTFPATRR
jgi:hypothetical protein